MIAPDPRRCGWPVDGRVCGERANVAYQVEVFDDPEALGEKRLAGLMLCARHNFPAREAG